MSSRSNGPPLRPAPPPNNPTRAPPSSLSPTLPPPSRPLDVPRPRAPPPSTFSNVGARLLNKRQSVSYHTAVASGFPLAPGAGAVPSVPALPRGMTGVGAGTAKGGLAGTGLDVEMLAGEGFRPEDFLKQCIAGGKGASAQTDDLRRLRTRLEAAMKVTETDLQKTVFKNYADFVGISKEIATLENEMLELKSVLEEWRTVPDTLESTWGDDDLLLGSASPAPNRRTQRNSLADLATLYKSQLSALWEGVEGSQKLLPYIAGRHLIAESATFVELNSATYKPKQHVHLFLLNDALLVSVKKRRGTGLGGKVRLVAERYFNLSEIVVVDLKDGGELNNAVKIKRGKETLIFRTDKPEEKRILLLAFKKVAEELMNRKRKDILNEAEARKGDAGNLRGVRLDYDGKSALPGFSPSQAFGIGIDDPSGKDMSWIGDFSDELSVAIATRTFEEAVEFVEKGKAALPQLAPDPHASFLFRGKLDQRTSELVAALLQDLSDHSIRKSGVVRTTAWLLRLGQGERARETFLDGRGTLVRRRTRQIKFEGDISMYISELAMVTFTLIKNTCEWYMAAFKDNSMASGFVRWATEQVEVYAETFRRQVYGADQDRTVIEESLEVTKSHGAMLRDVGLDFSFLLDALLRPEEEAHAAALPSEDVGRQRPGGKTGHSSAVAQARRTVFIEHGGRPAKSEERT